MDRRQKGIKRSSKEEREPDALDLPTVKRIMDLQTSIAKLMTAKGQGGQKGAKIVFKDGHNVTQKSVTDKKASKTMLRDRKSLLEKTDEARTLTDMTDQMRQKLKPKAVCRIPALKTNLEKKVQMPKTVIVAEQESEREENPSKLSQLNLFKMIKDLQPRTSKMPIVEPGEPDETEMASEMKEVLSTKMAAHKVTRTPSPTVRKTSIKTTRKMEVTVVSEKSPPDIDKASTASQAGSLCSQEPIEAQELPSTVSETVHQSAISKNPTKPVVQQVTKKAQTSGGSKHVSPSPEPQPPLRAKVHQQKTPTVQQTAVPKSPASAKQPQVIMQQPQLTIAQKPIEQPLTPAMQPQLPQSTSSQQLQQQQQPQFYGQQPTISSQQNQTATNSSYQMYSAQQPLPISSTPLPPLQNSSPPFGQQYPTYAQQASPPPNAQPSSLNPAQTFSQPMQQQLFPSHHLHSSPLGSQAPSLQPFVLQPIAEAHSKDGFFFPLQERYTSTALMLQMANPLVINQLMQQLQQVCRNPEMAVLKLPMVRLYIPQPMYTSGFNIVNVDQELKLNGVELNVYGAGGEQLCSMANCRLIMFVDQESSEGNSRTPMQPKPELKAYLLEAGARPQRNNLFVPISQMPLMLKLKLDPDAIRKLRRSDLVAFDF